MTEIHVGSRVRLNCPVSRLDGYDAVVVAEEERQYVVQPFGPAGQPESQVVVSKAAVLPIERKESQVSTSEVLNLTIGRATNEQLEATTAVWFKAEDVGDDGEEAGPVYLQVEGEQNLVPFNRGEAEWWPYGVAVALAAQLGVETVTS
jgi:hypothetical protein